MYYFAGFQMPWPESILFFIAVSLPFVMLLFVVFGIFSLILRIAFFKQFNELREKRRAYARAHTHKIQKTRKIVALVVVWCLVYYISFQFFL